MSSTPGFAGWRRQVLREGRWQVWAFVLLALAFVMLRWIERREPWNSDDMSLFRAAQAAAEGRHWALGTNAGSIGPTTPQSELAGHAAFRVGLLPLAVPAVWLLGPTATVYYLVPLLFSLLGFCALSWAAWRCLGPTVALAVAALHVAWPFELEHASVYLTDLPAAATSLVSLCLLDASTRASARGRALCAVLAGVAAWETYLLRNNGLVLLGPAYLVMLWKRETRTQTLWALAIAALGVTSQQALLVWRGLGFAYDWTSVRHDFANFAQHLRVYSWPAFLVRQFTYQVYTFGHGIAGWLAAGLMLGSVLLHLLLICFERRSLLLSVALFGLCTWLIYSYSIYEIVPGGVRATVPINYRLIQPFAYSSLLVWAWAAVTLPRRLADFAFFGPRWAGLEPYTRVAIPSALAVFCVAALLVRAPETYRDSGTRRLVAAIDAASSEARGAPTTIVGLTGSVRAARLFCCDPPERVDWRELTADELLAAVERNAGVFVLRDIPRELSYAGYLPPEEREAYRARIARIDEVLWRDAEISYLDTTYALFEPPGSAALQRSPASALPLSAPVPASFAAATADTTCVAEPDAGGDGGRLVAPERLARGWCQHAWPTDARVLPAARGSADDGVILRLRAEYDPSISVMVDLVERSRHGTSRRSLRLPSGTSYVPLTPTGVERSVSLVYRVRNRGVASGQGVRIHGAEWRTGRAFGEPTAAESGESDASE